MSYYIDVTHIKINRISFKMSDFWYAFKKNCHLILYSSRFLQVLKGKNMLSPCKTSSPPLTLNSLGKGPFRPLVPTIESLLKNNLCWKNEKSVQIWHTLEVIIMIKTYF